MKNGNIAIESLIATTVFIIFLLILVQVLLGFAQEDIHSQEVLEALNSLNNYALAYDLIGNDTSLLDAFDGLDLSFLKNINNLSRSIFLESIMKAKFQDLTISIVDDHIKGQVSFEQKFLVSHVTSQVYFDKKLITYGNNPPAFNKKNISDLIKKTHEDQEMLYVYKTKTGSKYHLEGCFYLRRSTTKKDDIEKISLFVAKYRYFLTPCQRCMEGP